MRILTTTLIILTITSLSACKKDNTWKDIKSITGVHHLSGSRYSHTWSNTLPGSHNDTSYATMTIMCAATGDYNVIMKTKSGNNREYTSRAILESADGILSRPDCYAFSYKKHSGRSHYVIHLYYNPKTQKIELLTINNNSSGIGGGSSYTLELSEP